MKLILFVAYWLVCSAPCAMGQATAPLYACKAVTLPDATRLVEVASDAQLQTAIDDAQPGDRIVLADGNYDGFYVLNVNGTAAAPIVFTAQNPRRAIISGSISADPGPGGRNLGVGSSSFVHFYHLRFTGGSVYGVGIGNASSIDKFGTCHDIRLQGCEIDNANQSLLHVASDSYNVEILCNDIHDNAKVLNDFCEGIYLGVGSTLQDAPHDVTIRGNHIYNIGRRGASSGYGEAIDIKAPSYRIFVEDNLIERITAHSQGAIVVAVDDFAYPTSPNTGIRITRNRIHDVRKAPDGFDGVGIWVGKNGVEVSNNVIWDVQKAGILVAADAANTTGETRVWHNTIGAVDGPASLSFNASNQSGTPTNPVAVDARNNLTLDGAADSFSASADDFVGTITGTADAGAGTGSAFALASESGAVNAGRDAAALTQDITGAPRPQGSGYDYGAFEYTDGTAPAPEANTLRLITAPQALTAGDTAVVEVAFTTTETPPNVPIQVRLLDEADNIIREETATASEGSDTLTFSVAVPAGSTGDGYQWNTQMFNRDWSALLAQQTQTGVSITAADPQATNSVTFVGTPATVEAGETYPVEVAYSASQPGIIHVQLFDRPRAPWQKIGQVFDTNVAAGSGTLTLDLPVDTGEPSAENRLEVKLLDTQWEQVAGTEIDFIIVGSNQVPPPTDTPAFGVCQAEDEANGVDCYTGGIIDNSVIERDLGEGYWSNWYVSDKWKGPLKAKFGPYGTPSWVEWNNQNTTDGAEFDLKIQKFSWHEDKDDVDRGFPTQIKEIANPLTTSFRGNWTAGSRGRGHINMTAWIYDDADPVGTRCDIIIHAWDNSGDLRRKYDEEQEFTNNGQTTKFRNLGDLIASNGITYQVLRTFPGGAGELASYNLLPDALARPDSSAAFETSPISATIDVRDVINKLIEKEANYDGEQVPINNSWFLHGMEWTVTGQTKDNGVGNSRGRFTFTDYTIPDIQRRGSASARLASPYPTDVREELRVFPNPFTNSVEYEYQVATVAPVTVELYTLDGRKLRTLKETETHRAGKHRGRLDTSGLGSGTYLIRIDSPDGYRFRKLIKR